MSGRFSVTLTPVPAAGGHVYGAETPEELRAKKKAYVAELFAADLARTAVIVESREACPVCGGTGQKPGKRRNPLRQIACKAKGCDGGWKEPFRETIGRVDSELDAIKILWRQPDTLGLWGIPYEMRPGQQPGDLWRAREAYRFPPPGTFAAPPIDLSDWTWLGQPGWWGPLSEGSERRLAIETFLRCIPKEAIPQNPHEWSRIGTNADGFYELRDSA